MTLLKSHVRWLAAFALAWALYFSGIGNMDAYYHTIVIYIGINAILAVSLNLVIGFTGQFSMGHAGFMAVGAYLSAFSTVLIRGELQSRGYDVESSLFMFFLFALLLGGSGAALAGFLVGLPSLRLKGDYLAIVTLGFGEIIRVILLNMEAVGGARGLPGIPNLTHFGWVYSILVFTLYIVSRVVKSQQGRSMLAVREDEVAAEAMGVNTTRAKVGAFVLGAFFAGIAGGLFAHFLNYLNPSIFDFNRSFEIIIMVVLGGMGSISGSVLAAVLLTGLREALRPLQQLTGTDYRMVIYSLLLILLMLSRPNGLFGKQEVFDFFRRRKNASKGMSL